MKESAKISYAMTKKEIIEEYNRLLAEYKKQAQDAREAQKLRAETEKHQDVTALAAAKDASVGAVIEDLGQLRAAVGKTFNDLTEKMSSQADRLEALKRGIELQEARLKELYDIEAAADALNKLIAAYDERKEAAELEYGSRFKELEETHNTRSKALESEFRERKEGLQKEMEEARSQWKSEKEGMAASLAEEKGRQKKEREREEAEYVYQRDRNRKLEEDAYEERKAALEKELKERKEQLEKTLAEREASVASRESELADLNKEVESFPKVLAKEVEQARQAAYSEVKKEMDQNAALMAMERDWERKVYEQKIAHLDSTIASQNKEIEQLKRELASAAKQVNEIAQKAIEGASLGRAFQSVNQIALEQARRQEAKESK